MAATVTTLLRVLSADPGRPRLTWYGPDGERIELSGAVLANWVTKTTNLLVEELDAGPGTVVHLDLPPHWRTLVWALATWQTGACVDVTSNDDGVADPMAVRASTTPGPGVVVTSDPKRASAAGVLTALSETIVVALPALARRFDGVLPPGAIDAASAVMTYGDQIGYVPETSAAMPALVTRAASTSEISSQVRHADLFDWARSFSAEGPSDAGLDADAAQQQGARILVRTATGAVADLLARALDIWGRDGSVVVLSPETVRVMDADAPRLERLVTSERVDSAP